MPINRRARQRKAKAGEAVLRPVHPNLGIEAAYRAKLDRMIAEMSASVLYWVRASYRQNEPEMASDAPPDASGGPEIRQSPAMALRATMRRLARRWQRNFDEAAPELAKYFATATTDRADGALRSILKRGGFTVEFKLSRAANDVLQATVGQNVALIKSIPAQYMTQVQGSVMRAIQTGRDLGQLTKDLEEQFGVTRRRAAFIARDQNNKATASITRVRQTELGITEATWQHSGGGRHPRPTHVAMSGKRYEIAKGMWDPAVKKYILPGEEPNCRCVSRPVILGFA